MGLFSWIKNLGKKAASTVKDVQIKQEVAENNKQLDKDRQMARGELQEYKKQEELEKQAQDRTEISEHLQTQQEKLSKQRFNNSVSLMDSLQYAQEESVTLYSRDKQTTFGNLDNVVITTDGLIYIINDDGDPVTGGPTFGRIFANPAGLIEEIKKGMLTLNVNGDGIVVDGPETEQVPRVMFTQKQGFVTTENKKDNYLKELGRLKQQINKLRGDNAALEQTITELLQERDDLERDVERMSSLLKARDREEETATQQANEIIKNQYSMQKDINRTYRVAELYKDVSKDAKQGIDQMSSILTEEMNQEEFDRAMSQIRDTLEFIVHNSDKISKINQDNDSPTSNNTNTVEVPDDALE